MQIFIYSVISSLITLAAIDAVWLNLVAKNFYAKHLGHLMAENVNLIPVLFFYPIYAAAISLLVVMPAINGGWGIGKTFVYGAILGLAAYSAYDLTNHATLRDWRLTMTLVDMLWGTILTGAASAVAVFVIRNFL